MPQTSKPKLHVFAGTFASREDACLYTEPQWEPEPGESATDEEYAAWEHRNPTWRLREHLQAGLDSDFIETIGGGNRYDYLAGYLVNDGDLDLIRSTAGDANVLVLIFPDALHRSTTQLASTSQLTYCGAFDYRMW